MAPRGASVAWLGVGVWISDGDEGEADASAEAEATMKARKKRPITEQIIPAREVDYVAASKAESVAEVMDAAKVPQVRGYLVSELDAAGATIASAAKVIADAQEANGAQVVSYLGEAHVVDTGPDHSVRLKAAEMNLKARGELQDKDGVSIFMKLSDEQLAGIASGAIDPATLIDLGPRVNEARG